MTEETAPQLPQQVQMIYKGILDQIDFMKKQQWVTTNYVVLIYAAIAWCGQHIEQSPRLLWVLMIVAIATGTIAIGLLSWFQYDLGGLRLRAWHVEEAYFSSKERESLGLKRPDHPYGRGWHVLAALILVCLVGALLVFYRFELASASFIRLGAQGTEVRLGMPWAGIHTPGRSLCTEAKCDHRRIEARTYAVPLHLQKRVN